jgi:hypothetical protein
VKERTLALRALPAPSAIVPVGEDQAIGTEWCIRGADGNFGERHKLTPDDLLVENEKISTSMGQAPLSNFSTGHGRKGPSFVIDHINQFLAWIANHRL